MSAGDTSAAMNARAQERTALMRLAVENALAYAWDTYRSKEETAQIVVEVLMEAGYVA